MNFKNEAHQQRYEKLLANIIYEGEVIKSALFILSSIENRDLEGFVIAEGIDFPSLKETAQSFNEEEQALIDIAANIINPEHYRADISLLTPLDLENREIVMEGLELKYLN